jgi:alkylation response protein AidB-like acyl-CoA dehydrogenase
MAISDHLALTEDERALQRTLRDFLTAHLASAELRPLLDSDPGYSPPLHERLIRELGLGGLTTPEQFGGLGLGQAEACVVHQELGRALYPGPFLASCLAASVLSAAGDPATCQRWLPLLADGTVTGTVAAAGRSGRWPPGPDSVRARQARPGWELQGSRWYVIAAHVADIFVVPALTTAGPAMFLVEAGSPGVEVVPMTGLDLTRRACAVSFEATPAVPLGDGRGDAARVLDQAEQDFLLATAAEAAGGIAWCLDASVGYAKEREQFGRPIGSFQAIAHQCADMLADLQSAAAASRYAAVASAQGTADAALATRVAALRAGESYRRVAETAIHVLGGVGFTWGHDAHLYYRRAWSAQRLAGGPQEHRAAIADLAGL